MRYPVKVIPQIVTCVLIHRTRDENLPPCGQIHDACGKIHSHAHGLWCCIALAAFDIIKSHNAEAEKIGRKVDIENAGTEELHVDKQKAVLTAPTAFNIIKNNHAESEKIRVAGEH